MKTQKFQYVLLILPIELKKKSWQKTPKITLKKAQAT